MTTPPLFADHAPQPAAVDRPSPEARRRQRQADCLAAGGHPLGLALAFPLGLHPDAAPADDRQAPGLRCGSCAHRLMVTTNGNRSWPKCGADRWRRISHGPGTDVRAWWPACPDHTDDTGEVRR